MDPENEFLHDKEYHDIVNNKELLKKCTEELFYNILDEITLGIILDMHKMHKRKCYDVDTTGTAIVDKNLPPGVDIFGQDNVRKLQECECPICFGTVAATRFAPHLEKCMGMGGRTSSRKASLRIANNNSNNNSNNNAKERDGSTYSGLPSDDEDDVDWNTGDKRRKKKHRNGTKKGKGTPKKTNTESEMVESINVDIEGDDDGDISLREFLWIDSNHSSPVDPDSGSSSGSTSKRKEKPKSKKNGKHERKSPSTSVGD